MRAGGAGWAQWSSGFSSFSHKRALPELRKHLHSGTLAPPEGPSFSCSPGKVKELTPYLCRTLVYVNLS